MLSNGAVLIARGMLGITIGRFSMMSKGLIDLTGGDERFVAKIDSVFRFTRYREIWNIRNENS